MHINVSLFEKKNIYVHYLNFYQLAGKMIVCRIWLLSRGWRPRSMQGVITMLRFSATELRSLLRNIGYA